MVRQIAADVRRKLPRDGNEPGGCGGACCDVAAASRVAQGAGRRDHVETPGEFAFPGAEITDGREEGNSSSPTSADSKAMWTARRLGGARLEARIAASGGPWKVRVIVFDHQAVNAPPVALTGTIARLADGCRTQRITGSGKTRWPEGRIAMQGSQSAGALTSPPARSKDCGALGVVAPPRGQRLSACRARCAGCACRSDSDRRPGDAWTS